MYNYLDAKKTQLEGNFLAQQIRDQPEAIIRQILPDPELKIKGSPGIITNWANIPWVAVFNIKETEGATEGVYVVYLFSEDMKRVYLTLNQGVTRPKKMYGTKDGLKRLQAKAYEIRANHPLENFGLSGFKSDDSINLSSHGLGSEYEKGTIFYKQYNTNNLPSNQELENDLKILVNFYSYFLNEDNILTEGTDFSGFSKGVEEGKRILKQHYMRERNRSLIKQVKEKRLLEKGELRCDVCNFSFLEKYGERGKNFIEGHHKKSISEMKDGDKTYIEDIALICSNCHRMIHNKMPWLSIEELVSLVKG
jgi:hypothetical protein